MVFITPLQKQTLKRCSNTAAQTTSSHVTTRKKLVRERLCCATYEEKTGNSFVNT